MAVGCLASLALYAAALLLLVPNVGPLIALFGIFVVVTLRWMRSDWPLY
jgi:hypothetical protein